jgi:hypothetical protein
LSLRRSRLPAAASAWHQASSNRPRSRRLLSFPPYHNGSAPHLRGSSPCPIPREAGLAGESHPSLPGCSAALEPVSMAIWGSRLSACRAVRQADWRCRRFGPANAGCPAVLAGQLGGFWFFRRSACRAVRQAGWRCRRDPVPESAAGTEHTRRCRRLLRDGGGPGKLPEFFRDALVLFCGWGVRRCEVVTPGISL